MHINIVNCGKKTLINLCQTCLPKCAKSSFKTFSFESYWKTEQGRD